MAVSFMGSLAIPYSVSPQRASDDQVPDHGSREVQNTASLPFWTTEPDQLDVFAMLFATGLGVILTV